MLSRKKNNKTIRIGTRSSALAMWQAQTVENQLKSLGYDTELIPVKSTGDLVLDKPLYELGITGIFTRTLDIAMLNEEIDIAVHSLKDVPTILPKGICQAAVLQRASNKDIIVCKETAPDFSKMVEAIIATGSLRRKAQWLNKYPSHQVTGLRGNVNSRLQKLKDSNWSGAIFAKAGLERLNITPENTIDLNWMIPAPAQGAIMITALEADDFSKEACSLLNHRETEICTSIEREFLNKLEGGCTAPIGAIAKIDNETIDFTGVLLSEDGSTKIEVKKSVALNNHENLAKECAQYILDNDGKELMTRFKKKTDEIQLYSSKELSKEQLALLANNLKIESNNFIQSEPCDFDPLGTYSIKTVVITRKNAVNSILKNESLDFKNFESIYCVGLRTKRAIEAQSGNVVYCAENSEALAKYLVKKLKPTEITYFCGDLRLNYLPDSLKSHGFDLNEVIVYETKMTPIKVNNEVQGLLFYSPSTVKSFISVNKADEKIAFCIGTTTAKEALNYFKTVKTAKVPTVESVIELVNEYYV
jgi:hydroxymethylbilane synthase